MEVCDGGWEPWDGNRLREVEEVEVEVVDVVGLCVGVASNTVPCAVAAV
ncbi:hypothetical protein A2U01_0056720, partial [Trifolium medium]|nr:hypothetical protein [Trifolium medium]